MPSRPPHRPLRSAAVAVAVVAAALAAGGCTRPATSAGGPAAPAVTATTAVSPATGGPAPDEAVAAADLAGHWTSDAYGDAYVSVQGATVRLVYEHDEGRMLATVRDGMLVGWWTEAPTRTPDTDAGDARFTITRTAGRVELHGGWRFGTTGDYTDNWNLVRVDGTVQPAAATVLADPAAFTAHP
ncbi:hypothetical protein AB0368_30090 [Actinoplanes sp. NPDC051475]|uniref:hypothetical protein n=1 Tax=Actinoplanes sp. NPDC051475 TaxID=3157225 RepID=UPI00344C8067